MSSRISEAYRLISEEIECLEQEASKLRALRAQLDVEAVVTEPKPKPEPKPKGKGQTTYSCPHCGETYVKEGYLKRHIDKKHNDEIEVPVVPLALHCESCDFTTPDDAMLMQDHTLHAHRRMPTRTERTRSA